MFSKEQKEGHDKRHKCSICGRVRFEKFMAPVIRSWGNNVQLVSRFGNGCWYCNDRKSCIEGAKNFDTY